MREVLRPHRALQSKNREPRKAHIAWTLTWAVNWAKDHQHKSSMLSLDAKWSKCCISVKTVKLSSRNRSNSNPSLPRLPLSKRNHLIDRRCLLLWQRRDLLDVSNHSWQRRPLLKLNLRKTKRPSTVLTNCSYRKVMALKSSNKKLRESILMSKKPERLKKSSKRSRKLSVNSNNNNNIKLRSRKPSLMLSRGMSTKSVILWQKRFNTKFRVLKCVPDSQPRSASRQDNANRNQSTASCSLQLRSSKSIGCQARAQLAKSSRCSSIQRLQELKKPIAVRELEVCQAELWWHPLR